MKKRALSLLLALVMVCGLLPMTARAEELDNGLEYVVYEDHVEITGYYGDETELVIPAQIEGMPVTVIGDWAFWGCYDLTSISIPASVISIAGNCFSDCESLSNISVDKNNPNYSSDDRGVLFDKNKTLLIQAPATIADSYEIPDSVISIGDESFSGCENLTDIVIPEGVTSIGDYAFASCDGLVRIDIPDTVTDLSAGAFYKCENATSINLPEGITSISNSAFEWCSNVTTIDIPDSVISIGESAFTYCIGLTDIDIPNSVTSISDWAFFGCEGLTRIDIPKNVTHIGAGAFAYCDNLEGIYADNQNPNYSSDNRGVLFSKDKTTLVQAPGAISKSYEIPATVTTIGDESFRGCNYLTSIDIPDGVTSIGYSAFDNCLNIASFDIPDSVTFIDEWAFSSCISITTFAIPDGITSISDSTFHECQRLTSIDIPDSVTSIGESAFFRCYSLTGIDIPSSVTYIGDAAFEDCENLTDIVIPEGVTAINWSTFRNCHSLTSIIIPDSITEIQGSAFDCCCSLLSIYFEGDAPDFGWDPFYEVTATAYYPVNNSTWTSDVMQDYEGDITWVSYDPDHPHKYTSTVIAPTCKEQGYTLYTCSCGYSYTSNYVKAPGHDYDNGICTRCGIVDNGLLYNNCVDHIVITGYEGDATKLVIPAEIEGLPVTIISDYAFSLFENLTSIKIPDSVTSIGERAFYGCSALTSIDISENVTYIGDSAFYLCSNLTGIHVDENNRNYSSDSQGVLFDKEKRLLIQAPGAIADSYQIPNTVTDIGGWAFADCNALTGINVPSSVTSIGYSAFSYCYTLTGIYVDENNPNYSSDNRGVLFDKEKALLIQAPSGITGSYRIPDTVTTISEGAFIFCAALTGIDIPSTVTYIDTIAFGACPNLTSIHFEGDAPEFGMSIFHSTAATAYYPATNPTWTANVRQNYDGNITWIGYNPEGSFYDVAMNSFYEVPVEWAVEKGITTGATDETFNPNGECLRAQVVTFLWRTAGSPEPTSNANPFVDVKPSDFYYNAVLWAVENGITTGTDATHFDPFGICNRAQVVTFLYRAQTDPQTGGTQGSFSDVDDDAWYSAPIDWAASNDITNGLGDGTFGIGNPCNRAQVVTFLYRAYN